MQQVQPNTHFRVFLLATVIARSIRYFGLAAVVYYAGDKAEQLIKRYKMKAVIAITVAVLRFMVAFKFNQPISLSVLVTQST